MTTFIPWLPEEMTTSFSWKTDVLQAADATEQHVALQSHPTVKFDLSYAMVGDNLPGGTAAQLAALRALLASSPGERFQIPLRHEAVYLESDMASGSTSMVLNWNRSIDWLRNNKPVYVEVNEDENGFIAVTQSRSHVGANANITLATGVPVALKASQTRVCPVITIQPLGKQNVGGYKLNGNGLWTLSGTLQEFYMYNQGTGISLTSFQDLTVFDRPAIQDGTDLIGEEYNDGLVLLGDPFTLVDTRFGNANVRRDLSFPVDSLDDWRYFKAVLFSLFGQQFPFWRPSFRPDLVLSVQPSSPTTSLHTLSAPDYRPWFGAKDVYHRLALTMSDGTTDYVEAASVVDNGDGTQTIALTATYTRGSRTITAISFLEPTRLASDDVVLRHLKVGTLTQVNLQTLVGNWVPAS